MVLNAFQSNFGRAIANAVNPGDWKSILPEWVEDSHPQWAWIDMDNNPDDWFNRIRAELNGGNNDDLAYTTCLLDLFVKAVNVDTCVGHMVYAKAQLDKLIKSTVLPDDLAEFQDWFTNTLAPIIVDRCMNDFVCSLVTPNQLNQHFPTSIAAKRPSAAKLAMRPLVASASRRSMIPRWRSRRLESLQM